MSADASRPTGSLTRRFLASGGWQAARILSIQGVRLASNLIMTRLLVPEAFGLMAFAATIYAGISLFSDLGIGVSVAREPDGAEPRFLRVAWVVNILRSSAVFLAMVAAAGLLVLVGPAVFPAGTVYADPRTPGLLAILALVPLLEGSVSTNSFLAERRLELRRLTLVNLGCRILGVGLMIGYALVWPTVWALAIGMVAQQALRMAASHLLLPGPRMGVVWDVDIAARLWTHGRWFLVSAPFGFIAGSGDKLILGALLDAHVFGLYTIASLWSEAARTLAGQIGAKTATSALSEVVRERRDRLVQAFARLQRGFDLLCLAGFVGVASLGGPLIRVLYPAAYHPAAHFVPILALSLVALRARTFQSLLLGVGDSRSIFLASVAHAAAVVALTPVGFAVAGIDGAIFAAALSALPAMPVMLWRARSHLQGRDLRQDWAWIGATCALGAGVMLLL